MVDYSRDDFAINIAQPRRGGKFNLLICQYHYHSARVIQLLLGEKFRFHASGAEVITDMRWVQGWIKNTTSSVAITSKTNSIHKTIV